MRNFDFLKRLEEEGVRMSLACGEIRAVTHLDVTREGIDRALAAVRSIAADPSA